MSCIFLLNKIIKRVPLKLKSKDKAKIITVEIAVNVKNF